MKINLPYSIEDNSFFRTLVTDALGIVDAKPLVDNAPMLEDSLTSGISLLVSLSEEADLTL